MKQQTEGMKDYEVCFSLISPSWNTETIDFNLPPIDISSQNGRVTQELVFSYKRDVIMVTLYNLHFTQACP